MIVIFVVGCPADWLNVGTTCMVFRGGGETFKEATDYCQVLCFIIKNLIIKKFIFVRFNEIY